MTLYDRLKKLRRHPGVIATVALAGTLVTGKMATHQNSAESDSPSQSEVMNYQHSAFENSKYLGSEFDEKIGQMFDISGTNQDFQSVRLALLEIANTPEGKKLLEDLDTFGKKIKISFPNLKESLIEGVGGWSDAQQVDLEVNLNKKFLKNPTETSLILFHELCHMRQKQDGAGCVNDLRKDRFEHTFAREAEARLMTSLMSLHLLKGGEQTGPAATLSVLDGSVYTTIKDHFMSENSGLSEQAAEQKAKEEILRSMLSGKNTDLVNQLIPSPQKEQFEKNNSDWFHGYYMEAGKETISSPVKPTYSVYPGTASDSISKIAQRLGVDKDILLPINGIDLTDVQKDQFGNIISATEVSRQTGEVIGNFTRSYDEQNRLSSMARYESGKLSKKSEYEYGEGILPVKITETYAKTDTIPAYTRTTTYDPVGNLLSETQAYDNGELQSTTWYKDNKKQKTLLEHQYGITEEIFDQDEIVSSRINRLKDGTVIDEWHRTEKPQNVNLNVIRSKKGKSL